MRECVVGRVLRGRVARRLLFQLCVAFGHQGLELGSFRGVLARDAFECVCERPCGPAQASVERQRIRRPAAEVRPRSSFGRARRSLALHCLRCSGVAAVPGSCRATGEACHVPAGDGGSLPASRLGCFLDRPVLGQTAPRGVPRARALAATRRRPHRGSAVELAHLPTRVSARSRSRFSRLATS